MVIARLSLGLSFLGVRNFLKLCHDEKPCTWWLGEKGLGSLQSRLARMLHHEYDALKGYRFLGGAISFYSVSCMSDVIFNPSLLNWSSLILTVKKGPHKAACKNPNPLNQIHRNNLQNTATWRISWYIMTSTQGTKSSSSAASIARSERQSPVRLCCKRHVTNENIRDGCDGCGNRCGQEDH